MQTKILDIKEYYIGKKFEVLLNDLNIPIKNVMFTPNFSNLQKVSHTYFEIYDGFETSRKLEKGEIPVHNHVVDYPPSAGDVYTTVTLISNNPNFTTSYINLPNGSSYAIVVTNPTLAKDFVTKYPKDQIGNNPPEFPDFIFNKLQALVNIMGSNTEGRLNAIVSVLDKYNSGISFLKKDAGSGLYEKIAIKQTTVNGITTYQQINCQ